jgi:class 3 adenylate cyclase/tetratricopeptide (TPR) repeat protein
MQCAHCSNENPIDAKFCQNCGRPLEIKCPSCDTLNAISANFCKNCGMNLAVSITPSQPLSHPKSTQRTTSLQGERRLVTVMFADISGFTAMAESMDSEAVRDMMNACFEWLVPVVQKYGGTVDKFIGDEIMALFGAPVAHGNDAERALQAALEMTEALVQFNHDRGSNLGLHFGINTGRIIAGGIGPQTRQEYSVMGDAVNLAARLEDASERGEIFVGPDTYQLTASMFDFELLNPILVKGKTEPVNIYRLLQKKTIRTRFAAVTERGLTPFIGRKQELNNLKDCFNRVKNQQGQVIFIFGEAGMGKSRLLLEFRNSIENEAITWLEGQCISFGRQNAPYLPMIDILKDTFGVEEEDNEAQIIQRINEGVIDWEESHRETLPFLKYLLNVEPGDQALVDMDPRMRRAGILEGLRALLLQESRQQPLVVVIEDLHWIDQQSEEALDVLVDVLPSAPILLVLTCRQDYKHSFGERTYFNRLTLTDLQPEESAALAQAVLDVTTLPLELSQLIASKAEGNPFYVEEMTRSLIEMGVLRQHNGSYALARAIEKIHVPNTIQEIILSRMDRLPEEVKLVLQLASVIGREFPVRLLERISDPEIRLGETLGELKASEFILQKVYFPELAYMFKHALTQDVAYSTLLRARRRALHRIIGSAIEELYADRLAEQFETLAHHFFDGEAWQKALEYLIKSGEKAAAAYANQNTLVDYARALEVCDKLGDSALETAVEVTRRRGFVNYTIGNLPGAIADFDRMLTAARRLGDQHLEGMALAYRGWIEGWNHDPETAEASLRAALDVANKNFEDVRLFASVTLGRMFLVYNRHAEAVPFYQAAEVLASSVDDPMVLSWWSIAGKFKTAWEGRFDDALAYFERWRGTPEKSRDISALLGNQWFEALTRCGKGEYEQALMLLENTIAICERIGEIFWWVRVLNTLGWIYGELQDHQRAFEWNSRSLEGAQKASFPNLEVENNARLNLGDNLLAMGRQKEAEAHFQQVEQVVRKPRPQDRYMLWRYSQHLFHSYGELWLLRGNAEKALSYADECLELAENSNSLKNIIKGRRLRGQALLAQGNLNEAEQELMTALKDARQVGNPPQLWQTHVALGDLRHFQGKNDEAYQAYADALSVVDEVASNLKDQSLRDTFLKSGQIQEIRGKAQAKMNS